MTVAGITNYGALCGATMLFLLLPGPGTFSLITSTAKGGLRGGAAGTLGIVAGDQVLFWLAVGGVAAVFAANPHAFEWVRWAGAAYLGWIGLKLLLARGDGATSVVRIEPGHYARQTFFITLLNPKSIVFYMAFVPLFIDPASAPGIGTFAAMAATIATLTVLYSILLCGIASRVAGRLKADRRIGRWLERTAGLVILAFSIRLLRD